MQVFRSKLATHLKPYLIALIILLQMHALFVAFGLSKAIVTRSASYLNEVTTLAANLLDARFSTVLTGLRGLSADLSGIMADADVHDLPEETRRAVEASIRNYDDIWDYRHLYIADSEGRGLYGKTSDDPASRALAKLAFQRGRPTFSRTDSFQTILYSVPLVQDGRITSVLIAERSTRFAMSMVSSDSFQNKGIAFLMNDSGQALFKIFNGVPHIGPLPGIHFLDKDDRLIREAFGQDFSYMESGHLKFDAPDGKAWILSYSPLKVYDLAIMFAAPEDLLLQSIPSLRYQNIFLNILSFLLILFLMGDLILLQKAYQKKLETIEFTDPLTSGDNVISFGRKMKKLLVERQYALVSIDVNKFKLINSVYGIDKANEFLLLIHELLSARIGDNELCARDSGDQFLLLLEFSTEEALRFRIKTFMEEILLRKRSLGLRHKYGLSAGVYVIEDRIQPTYVMLDAANLARKFCKYPPYSECTFYDSSVVAQQRRETTMLNDFSIAMERGDFQIWLQPKVNIRTDMVSGCEALVRWKHPSMGTLMPADFLPVFEDNGRIVELDLFVFEQVCRTLASWSREGREIIPISVNLSRQHLQRQDFLDGYLRLVRQYRVNPHWLELELTENLFSEDSVLISQAFEAIRACGLRCAIDDFGIGYSSLSVLRQSNVDTIKLDRSFFTPDGFDDQSKAVIHTITQLATALGLTCVAEGVEDASIVNFLLTTDCSQVQGYAYSKPLPVAEFEAFTFTAEGRRRYLNTGGLHSPASLFSHVQSLRLRPLRQLLSCLGEVALFIVRKDTRELLFFNAQFAEVFPAAKVGMICHEVCSKHCPVCPIDARGDRPTCSLSMVHEAFGGQVDVTVTEHLWEDYIPALVICMAPARTDCGDGEEAELSTLRQTAAVWEQRAHEDDLTRLLRKNRFREQASKALARDRSGALFIIDLDGFKMANDRFGHQMGDEILKNSAERLRMSFRKDDLLGRYGGDEFIVYAPNFTSRTLVEQRLRTLLSLMRHSHTFDGTHCTVSASIGVAFFPQDARSYKDLVQKADMAMYEAKRRGKDQYVYYAECEKTDGDMPD